MTTLREKTMFITGGTRGIGRQIALRAARDGANIAVVGKTKEPHAKLPGTVDSVAKEVEAAGGRAIPIACDVRFEDQISAAVRATVDAFGGIDILVNNASAISLTGTEATTMKRYDLMHQVNVRGTFACSRACIPYLRKASNPHILNNSPPLDMAPKWFRDHVVYTMTKYGMSMCVLGMADELRPDRIAVNALWPRTPIATSAMDMLAGEDAKRYCRKPEIMADAAYAILTRDSTTCTGNFFIDDEVLREVGVSNFDVYAVDPTVPLALDLFVDAP